MLPGRANDLCGVDHAQSVWRSGAAAMSERVHTIEADSVSLTHGTQD
jgi:hypothetical protein